MPPAAPQPAGRSSGRPAQRIERTIRSVARVGDVAEAEWDFPSVPGYGAFTLSRYAIWDRATAALERA